MAALDFSAVCRVCCLTAGSAALSLFRVSRHRKVMACADVQVWQNDGLPGQICSKCAAKLHISFQFKKQCERSDVRLRRCRDSGKYVESNKREEPECEPIVPESPAVSLSLPEDCAFPNCSLSSIADNRHYDSIQNIMSEVGDVHIGPRQGFSGSDILASVADVELPIRGEFDMSENYGGQSLGSLSLDNSFGSQVIEVSQSIGEQMLALENLAAADQLEPILRNDNPYDIARMDLTKMTEDADEIKHSPPEIVKPKKVRNENDNYEILHCPICNKIFTSVSKLNRHARTHSDEILYRCDVCNKGFIHGGNFKVHLRMHSDERPFSCHVCHKSCRQQQDLNKHMRTHTGERPHVCGTCQKAFTTSSNLVAHERIHRGEKPYVCSVCQKAFCQSNELTKHVRTHTGEKSHICPVCDKGFNGSSTLVVHMRIHTGERPYVCTVCNKGFTQSSCLAAHSRKHSEDDGYPCPRCPRSFITPQDLKRHVAAHAPANYPCKAPNCVRIFSRPNDLLRHTKLVHSNQIPKPL